ncbi:MAG: ABC transporter ATP-binding protein [Desulfarculus sp.]|nr:MAG: ABC transporter ATP-binding protein [Desulfarculus sp.]
MPAEANSPAVAVEGLHKSYGAVPALRGVSFTMPRGGVFAYLGPNGAGKTTTINILCGLLRPDSGRVTVCGLEVSQEPVKVKARIGVVPDESNLYPELSCRRNLDYLGELYGLSRGVRRARVGELLGLFSLADRAEMPFRALSRGLKRRLVLAAAMVHAPEVLFLDEPTIGLDVPSARALRQLIRRINQEGTTVFLTTHNLAEAEELAERVCILIQGRVVAMGSPGEIRGRVERGTYLRLGLSGEVTARELLSACPAVKEARPQNGLWRLEVEALHPALAQSLAFAEARRLLVNDVGVERPTLEEAFLAILQQGQPPEVGQR